MRRFRVAGGSLIFMLEYRCLMVVYGGIAAVTESRISSIINKANMHRSGTLES